MNQSIVFGRSWTPSLKGGTNSAATAQSKDKSGDNFDPSLNAAFDLPLPASNVACSCPLNLPGSSIPDHSSAHDTSSGYHSSEISENDIVIAVMGPTGVGKSSFVNKAAGRSEAVIGYGLKSQTRGVHPVRCQHPDGRRNIVLVDTPGFDDTHLSDSQILRIIANWLKDTYQNNVKLSGLLYLHRISDVRMAGTPLRNLAVFKDLCGASNLKNIVLVTTMWDEVEEDVSVGYKREEELSSDFWKDMISLGSHTCRFQGTYESAWEIIDRLDLRVPRPRLAPLQIQEEMVDRHLPLRETAAARTLLRSLASEFKKVWVRLRNGARRTTGSKKPSDGPLRHPVPSRSPTLRSMTSGSSWSAVSPFTDTSSITSRNSEHLSSPGGASSGCSANGRRNALLAIIAGLRLARQMADITSITVLRGSIGTVLHIAQHIEGMGGTHHVISQVLEGSGWLLEEIAQYAAECKLPGDMKRALSSFQRELGNLQGVVMNISSRNPVAPFLLHDADIQVIGAFTASIKQIYDMHEVKFAKDNRHVIIRLEDQLMALRNSPAENANVGYRSLMGKHEENGLHSAATS